MPTLLTNVYEPSLRAAPYISSGALALVQEVDFAPVSAPFHNALTSPQLWRIPNSCCGGEEVRLPKHLCRQKHYWIQPLLSDWEIIKAFLCQIKPGLGLKIAKYHLTLLLQFVIKQ